MNLLCAVPRVYAVSGLTRNCFEFQPCLIIIVTLAEATPVYEAMRLEEDLKRADIATKWWVINSSLYHTGTTNQLLSAKASNEIEWINKVQKHANGNFAVIAWSADEIKGDKLLTL